MSREIGFAYENMTSDMRMKLGSYMHSLEMRYGDPRVYEMQQEERRQRQAAVEFAQAKSHETALRSAYNNQREVVRSSHKNRIATQGRRRQSDPKPPPAQSS